MENEQRTALLMRMLKPSVFDPETVERRILDVQYGLLPAQKLDIYYPNAGKGPWPLIIYVHGGGWYLGDKRECALDCIIPALKRGYAIVSVDYRLYPAVKYPEFLFDVNTAIRWARANAAEYFFDPEHFAVIGDSSGAHLSLMAAFTDRHPECEGIQYGWPDVSSRVQAVVDLYGIAVLEADNLAWVRAAGAPEILSEADPTKAPLDQMLAAFTDDRSLLPFLSPIAYVHPEIPPVLILHGEMDSIVPVQHSTVLAERIRRVCGRDRVQLRLYPGYVHSDRAFLSAETSDIIIDFLDGVLK